MGDRRRDDWTKRQVTCPKCGECDARLIESCPYGKWTKTLVCKVCAQDWIEEIERDDE